MDKKELIVGNNNEKPTSNENPSTNEINNVLTNDINRIFNDVLWGFRVTVDRQIKTKDKEKFMRDWSLLNKSIKQFPLSITYDDQQKKIKTIRNNKIYLWDCIGNKELENRIKEGGSLTITFKDNMFDFHYDGDRYGYEYGPEKYYDPSNPNEAWREQVRWTQSDDNKNWETQIFSAPSLLSGLSNLIWGVSPTLPTD